MMSDRPSDRATITEGNVPGDGPATRDFANGSVASSKRRRRSPYLTPHRLAVIGDNLTPADRAVIDIVTRFGLASGPQLARALFGASDSDGRASRRVLRRLADVGLLATLERRIGGVRAGSSGLVYRVGPVGLRLMGDRRRILDEPGLHHALHTLAVTELFVELKVAEQAGEARVSVFDPEPDCWRSYIGPHGQPVVLKPDAFCDVTITGTRRLWFVEVDRGTVSTNTLRAKLKRYAEYLEMGTEQERQLGVFPRVVWTSETSRRADHLGQLFAAENARLGAELHRLLPEEWTLDPP